MSNDNQPNKHNSDEIDIIQLFSYFGRGIRKFFDAILGFFKWIFHVFISLLILIQKNLVYFLIAAAIGFIGGGIFDHSKSLSYQTTMVVKPNFSSTEQLYNNIAFYNELAESQDSVELGKVMGISSKEAATVSQIIIEPSIDKVQKLKLYDDFIKKLDTLTRQSFDYETFETNLSDYDAVYHKVTVYSKSGTVAKKMQDEIVSSVSKNNYFKKQQETKVANIVLQDSLFKKQLSEIDSLQAVYKETLIASAKNNNAGTNISLSEGNGNNSKRELELLLQIDNIREDLVNLNEEKIDAETTVNVVAEFPERGIKVRSVSKSYKFILPVFFVGILLIFLLLVQLNTFLKKYTR